MLKSKECDTEEPVECGSQEKAPKPKFVFFDSLHATRGLGVKAALGIFATWRPQKAARQMKHFDIKMQKS